MVHSQSGSGACVIMSVRRIKLTLMASQFEFSSLHGGDTAELPTLVQQHVFKGLSSEHCSC
jgi:hypothetical protein